MIIMLPECLVIVSAGACAPWRLLARLLVDNVGYCDFDYVLLHIFAFVD